MRLPNPFQSAALAPCYDGESQPDEPVELVDSQPDGTPDATPVEPTDTQPVVEPPEPEPLFSATELEQRIAERLAAVESEWQAKFAAKDSEVAAIKARYDQATVERSLQDAAIRGDAFNPEQILPILRSHTTIDANGNPVVQIENFVMTPAEAITWMRSQPDRFGNLFRSNIIGGLGGHSAAGGAKAVRGPDVRSMTPEQYRAAKRENPGLLGFGGVS